MNNSFSSRASALLACATVLTCITCQAAAGTAEDAAAWRDTVLRGIETGSDLKNRPSLDLVRQDFEQLQKRRSVVSAPLVIGERHFQRGLGTHSFSLIKVTSREPIVHFSAWVGVNTHGGPGTVDFRVEVAGKEAFASGIMKDGQAPKQVDLALDPVTELILHVGDGGDGPSNDHADWADAQITLRSGQKYWLDELSAEIDLQSLSPFPFSFQYQEEAGERMLAKWQKEEKQQSLDSTRDRTTTTWTDPETKLRVTYELTKYRDFPAADWVLYFENAGTKDTGMVADVNAGDVAIVAPRPGEPYKLYRTHGGTPDTKQLTPSTQIISRKSPQTLRAGNGRSSTEDFPFFKIDTQGGAVIVAVGWSGCWKATATSPDDQLLRIKAGLELSHFRLHPGEKVRTPRMLMLFHKGDTWDANARFRELIYKHYAAKRADKPMLPMLFCNTCFTRGGGWLNECNAENQISLINAYAPLGLEALLTDAGWFRGGWPAGAGNWTPREDAYPQGMGPVAAAAKAKGMVYGLWYEPERVVAGTDMHRNHPEWLLHRKDGVDGTFLLNFGLPEVQEYFFNIVKDFMKLPGFRFYRQDFNMDPLPYWRFSDTTDRQGISEMKYVEGLYAYWDRIATAWPDSIREECASGGHRMDLETIMRMHLHQKTDYWFNDDVDQTALWGTSQYVPNNTMVAHLNNLNEYSFHSTMGSSLCLGWIADAKDFDFARAKKYSDRYMAVRHLLVGAWYPLLPAAQTDREWSGVQYHRADLDEGMLLVFRRAACPYRTVDVTLRGLNPDAQYELISDASGSLGTFTGAQLGKQLQLTLGEPHRSDLIVYKRK